MAGKIKQTSELEFKTKGAQKVQSETQQVGKSVTRLGQSTASASRQFSAQANGLGGLVAAYAGAAANIFAIQQAFAALNRAAQFEQLIAGTNTLAVAVGTTGPQVIQTIRTITNEQLTLAEASKSANIALSAGFDNSQIEGLSAVSLKASRALGRDLNDAFTRLTRGAAKLEPELLDELGIFTRIAPAAEKYAAKIGKSAADLTEFERRQAFVNAAIEEGERKFGNVNTIIPTTAESFEQLSATVLDLATQIGSFIAEKLVPLAEFFTNNLAARLTLFGLLLRQIGSTAFGLFGSAATSAFGKAAVGVDFLVGKLAKLGPTVEAQKESLSGIGTALKGKDFNLQRLTGKGRDKLSPLVKSARSGDLGILGAGELNKQLIEERKRLQETKKELLAKKRAAEAAGRGTKTLTKELNSTNAALRQTRTALIAVKTNLNGVGRGGLFLVGTFNKIGKTAKFAGTQIRRFARGLNIAALAIAGLVAAASTLAEFVGLVNEFNQILISLGQTVKAAFGTETEDQAKKAISGIVSELLNANEAIKNFNTTVEGISPVGRFTQQITARDIGKELNASVLAAADTVARGGDQADAIKAAQERVLTRIFGSRRDFKQSEKRLADNIKRTINTAVSTAVKDADKLSLAQQIAEASNVGSAEINRIIQKDARNLAGFFGPTVASDVGITFKATEQGLQDITAILPTSLAVTKDIGAAFARINDLQKQFRTGTVTAVQAQQAEKSIRLQIEAIEESIDKIRADTPPHLQQAAKFLINQLTTAKNILEVNEKILGEQTKTTIEIDKQVKLLEKQFSAEIKLARLARSIASARGSSDLISDEKEARVELLKIALKNFDLGKKFIKQTRERKLDEEDLGSIEKDRLAAALKGEEVLLGARLKLEQAAKKQALTIEKSELDARGSVQVKQLQNQLTVINQRLKLDDAINKSLEERRKAKKREIDLLRQEQDLNREIARFGADSANRQFQTLLDTPAAGLITAGQEREFTLRLEAEALERFIADQELLQQRAQEDTDRELAAIADQRKQLEATRKLEDKKIKKQEQIAIKEAQIAEKQREFQVKLTNIRKQFLIEEAKILDKFIIEFAKVAGVQPTPKDKSLLAPKFSTAELDKLNKELSGLQSQSAKLTNSANVQKTTAALRATKDNELTAKENELKKKLALTVKRSNFEIDKAADAFSELTRAASISSNKGLKVAVAGLESFGENAKTSLNSMFKAIREGTLTIENFKQGFQDFILSIVDDIQASITEEFIVNPIKDFLATQLQGLFPGIFGAKANPAATTATATSKTIPSAIKTQTTDICACLRELGASSQRGVGGQGRGRGIDSAAFKNLGREQPAMLGAGKADPVRDIMAANEALAGQTGNIAGEMDEFGDTGLSVIDEFDVSMTDFGKGGVNSINSLGTSFSSFADTALNSLFSMKTLAMGIGAGIGGAIGGPGGAIAGAVIGAVAEPLISAAGTALMAGFGFSGGGYVRKMAAGGMMRDRVPAMLEPGEFVMQRKAVNRIGAQNLSAMNGTGNGMPNISVEVKNEGSPKDAQAQVKPQMDVNKMVVEIVTRDIRNNGPIRKTLRTGAE